jgi:hypothetical protein
MQSLPNPLRGKRIPRDEHFELAHIHYPGVERHRAAAPSAVTGGY